MSRPGFISELAVVAAAVMSASCYEPEPLADYGLPAVELRVEPADLGRLRAGTFTDTPVPVVADLFGASRAGKLWVAGRSSVDDHKKSFNLVLDGVQHRLDAMSRDESAMRAYLCWHIHAAAGFATPALRYVAVFLNGEYLGLYLLHDNIDRAFFTARGREPIAIYAARDGATMERSADVARTFASRLDTAEHTDLRRLVSLIHQPEASDELDRLLDWSSVSGYMAAALMTYNSDGIDNNFILYRTRDDPRFAVLPWDLDHSLHVVIHPDDGAILFESNAMMRRAWDDDAARDRIRCALAALDHKTPPSKLEAVLEAIADTIAEAWDADPVLGAGPGTIDDHVAAITARNLAQHEALLGLCPP